MFPNIDHDALIKKWGLLKKKPHEIFRIILDHKDDSYHRDEKLQNKYYISVAKSLMNVSIKYAVNFTLVKF